MSEKKFLSLLQGLLGDLGFAGFYWVLLALAVVLAMSWWLAGRLRDSLPDASTRRNTLQTIGAGGLRRVAFPLLAAVLVMLLRKILDDLQVEHLSLLFLLVPLLVAWAMARVLVHVLRCAIPHGGFLNAFERFITVAVWVGMVLDMTGMLTPLIELLEQVRFGVGKQRFDLWMVLHGSVTVVLTLLLALWVASLIENRLLAAEQLDGNLREVLGRLAKALLSVIALLVSLSLVGIDVTALSVFSGALAVGLGFGLQKIASNYVSGFIILLDRSIRLGNLVAVDDKTTGTVTQITTRFTVLRTLTGTEFIIPNEYLVGNIVRNLSFSDTRVRVSVAVQVAYDTDLDRVMPLIADVAQQHPRVLADPPPGVLLTEFADSGINLELGFWVADPEKGTGDVRSEINLAIWKTFREHHVEIPFPQREVRLLGNET